MLDNREIQPKPHFQDNNLSRASSHEPGISNLARGVDYRWAVIGVPYLGSAFAKRTNKTHPLLNKNKLL